ncbi:MAG: PilZ domain-containing protein [Bdellovibrionota bacterium]
MLPRPLRDELARRKLDLPNCFPDDVQVRLARSREDFMAVFELLEGELTKYHALPSTTTLLVLFRGRIVGTASLIRSNSFGTPVDAHPDIAFLKESGVRLVTLSSFKIADEFSSSVFYPFVKGIFDYCMRSFGTEVLSILASSDRELGFFESILLFEALPAHSSGRIATLRMNRVRELYSQVYEKRPRHQNLARFLTFETPNVELPLREYNKLCDPVLTPSLMRELFAERTGVFDSLTDYEKQVLHDLYDSEEYRAILPPVNLEARELFRRDKRFEVDLPSRVLVANNTQINGCFRNVSAKGLLFDSERALREGERYTFQLPLSPSRQITIEGVILRNEVKRRYAIRITEAPREWAELIGYLENDLLAT